MPRAIIQLAYRQLIHANSTTPFEKEIFHLSFAEFLIQQQSFSKGEPLHTWSDLKERFPRADPALPFKVGFAINGPLSRLDKQIPDLQDTLGRTSIPFADYKFELIRADINDPKAFLAALTFWSGPLTLCDNIADHLVLALGDHREKMTEGFLQTFTLQWQPSLAIVSYGSFS